MWALVGRVTARGGRTGAALDEAALMKSDGLGVARQMLRRYGERAQRLPATMRSACPQQ
jgi:hypothetical protein